MLHEREESMMCAECGDEFALQVRNRRSYRVSTGLKST